MNEIKYFVTGGAGFIGSHIVDRLVEMGFVTVYDNLNLGSREFIKHHLHKKNFQFIQADLLDFDFLKESIKGCDVVFHLAANSDINEGTKKSNTDLLQGTIATYHVLEAMRLNDIKKIVFASTSAIYGEPKTMPTPEDYGPLFPISLYGASKVAGEALISAFCHLYEMQAWIFRFANIVGERGTHGIIVDFVNKLQRNPEELEILGNGKQAKPYLYVKDCVDGILFGFRHAFDTVNYFNLGCHGNTSVRKIAAFVVEQMNLKDVRFVYTGGDRGWKGDVPLVEYDIKKMSNIGWNANYNSDEAVKIAIKKYLSYTKCKC